MGNCRFTVKDKAGNIKKQDLTEQEFKKYLAKEGLSEFIKSGELKTDMDFLKDYLVVPKEQSVKKLINKATGVKQKPKETPLRSAKKEAKYEAEVRVTERLSKKIEEGKLKLQQLRDTVKEKFAEYDRFKTQKNKEALDNARQNFKDKLKEQRDLSNQKFKDKVQELKEKAKEKISEIKEQGKSLADITKALRDDIKNQLQEAKKGIFRGAKIRGMVAQRIMNKINNAKTPLQLLTAVDYVAKSLEDIEYTNKLDKAKALSNRIKKISKSLPINLRLALNGLAKVSPKEIADVDTYIDAMNKAVDEITQNNPMGINETEINKLAETINKNNLKNRVELVTDLLARKMSADEVSKLKDEKNAKVKEATTKEAKDAIREEYNNKINDVIEANKSKLNKPVSDSIEDMKKSLDEYNDLLGTNELDVEETGEKSQERRDNLEAINQVLRNELTDYDTSGLDKEELEFFEAITKLDVSNLSDKDLKFLNYAINNFIENSSFDGVGAKIANKYRYTTEINKPAVRKLIEGTVLKLNAVFELLYKARTLDVALNSLFSNTEAVAAMRAVSGFGDWINSYGSKNGFKGQLKVAFDEVSAVLKKTGVDKSLEAQHRLGMVLYATQYKEGLTATEIQAEFEGRKQAILESVERAEKELEQGKWKRDNQDITEMYRKVYENFAKDAKTPQELIDKLTDKEKQVRDIMLSKFADMADGNEKMKRRYKNEEFESYVNFFPIDYIGLSDNGLKQDSSNLDNILTINTSNNKSNIKQTQSTAFEKRTLKAGQVRQNSIVNFNVVDVFQNKYREQLYDLNTFKNRLNTYLTITSPEFLELLGGNKDARNTIINSFKNRFANETTGLLTARDTGNALKDTWQFMKGGSLRGALGGVGIPFIKQYVATAASVMANINPNVWLTSISVIARNKEAFNEFISQSPVSLRHEQEMATTGGVISARDLKKLASSYRKAIKGLDNISEKALMTSLKAGDQSSAGWAYLSYYMKNLMSRGIIKDASEFDIELAAKNPDKIAQQYAETETATTLNINEAVNKPIKPLFNNIAFVGFAVNAKLNLLTNLGRAVEANGVSSLKDRAVSVRKIGGHIAEIIAFNKISQYIRYVGLVGAATVFKGIAGYSDDDEENKDKKALYIDQMFNSLIENNDKNSQGYLVADLLFGQIGESWAKPVAERVTNAYSNVVLGTEKKSKLYTAKEASKVALAPLGMTGITISNVMDLFEGYDELKNISNDATFRQNKFGYVNALGQKVIEPSDMDKKVPTYMKYMQGASFLSQIMNITTGSPKEMQIFTSKIPMVNKNILTKMYGKDVKLQTEAERYGNLTPKVVEGKQYYVNDKFSNIIIGDVDYVLNTEQLKKRQKYKEQYISSVYNQWMKESVTALKLQRPDFIKSLKENPDFKYTNTGKDIAESLKRPYKYTNEKIIDYANIISENMLTSDYMKKDKDGIEYLDTKNFKRKDELK